MPRLYENAKQNFSSFEEFKEVASKTLNEIYGRVKPLDVIDFSYNNTHFKAVGYYDDEVIPAAQREGAPLSPAAANAEALAREQEPSNKALAVEEAAHEELRIKALYAAKEPVSFEDLIIAAKLGIALPEEIATQLSTSVKQGKFSFEAAHAAGLTHIDGVPTLEAAKNALKAAVANQNSEAANSELTEKDARKAAFGHQKIDGVVASAAAIDLAKANGVDLKLVTGTGSEGNIKVSDVKDYIANNAPAKENAIGNGEQQSNA